MNKPTFVERASMPEDDARDQKNIHRSGPDIAADRDSGGGKMGLIINDTIGKRLQAHYRALADEPLPDRFMVLLAQLRAKELKS